MAGQPPLSFRTALQSDAEALDALVGKTIMMELGLIEVSRTGIAAIARGAKGM